MAKTIFVAGSTGGHVYPAIALAQELPSHSICFFTTDSREDFRIVSKYKFPYKAILASSKYLYLLAFFRVMIQFLINRPHKIVATGGGTTSAVLLAAVFLRIPIYLYEQNSIPGRVTRLFCSWAKQVSISFEESRSYLGKGNIVLTGNPVRKTFLSDPELDQQLSLLDLSKKTILVFGGSQGAMAINQFIENQMGSLLENNINVIWLTGNRYFKHKGISSRFLVKTQSNGAILLQLSYTEAMDKLYQVANLVLCRSGATTIAELIHFQKIAILVTYPFATDNHQLLNAKSFLKQFEGSLLLQEKLFNTKLFDLCYRIFNKV